MFALPLNLILILFRSFNKTFQIFYYFILGVINLAIHKTEKISMRNYHRRKNIILEINNKNIVFKKD